VSFSLSANLWVADKVTRIAFYQKLIEDLDGYLADPDLDLRLRHRYTPEVASMLRAVAEEKGELPTRAPQLRWIWNPPLTFPTHLDPMV
jgi:hypothetical protein